MSERTSKELVAFLESLAHGDCDCVIANSRHCVAHRAADLLLKVQSTPEPFPEHLILDEATGAVSVDSAALARAAQGKLPREDDSHDYRSGVFTNCGYVGTASGHVVRDGTWWVATFRNKLEADRYVEWRNSQPASSLPPGADETEAMRRDAARYEWMREHWSSVVTHIAPGDGDCRGMWVVTLIESIAGGRPTDPQTIDQAIDSAMEREDRATATKADPEVCECTSPIRSTKGDWCTKCFRPVPTKEGSR